MNEPLWKKTSRPHSYPGDGTSDCAYKCGAWMGPFNSGAPDGINPFGDCPKAPPEPEPEPSSLEAVFTKLVEGLLPCNSACSLGKHDYDCPSVYRARVLKAMWLVAQEAAAASSAVFRKNIAIAFENCGYHEVAAGLRRTTEEEKV